MWTLIKPLAFLLPPELAHAVATFGIKSGAFAQPKVAALDKRLAGLQFPNPLGMAAGFDKNGILFPELMDMGFGAVEIGTVTPEPQPGNLKPRLFRLNEDKALINRMGFNNDGMEQVAKNVETGHKKVKPQHGIRPILGINLGKNKWTPEEEAHLDFAKVASCTKDLGDYFVINVSSPNTVGLRALQSEEKLKIIIGEVQTSMGRKPLFVKIAPDLEDRDAIAVADLCMSMGVHGIIATNTTLKRDQLKSVHKQESGGLSGLPLQARSREVLKLLKTHVGQSLAVVSVGGIDGREEAQARIDLGADLIQVYTGLIYQGPRFPQEILQHASGLFDTRR